MKFLKDDAIFTHYLQSCWKLIEEEIIIKYIYSIFTSTVYLSTVTRCHAFFFEGKYCRYIGLRFHGRCCEILFFGLEDHVLILRKPRIADG